MPIQRTRYFFKGVLMEDIAERHQNVFQVILYRAHG